MAFIKFQDFNSDKLNTPHAAYLFAGEESFLIDLSLKKIEKIIDAGDLNREIFYGGELSADDVVNALQTLPFLGEKRLIIIKEAHKIKAADAEVITEYIDNPSDTSCLVFLYAANYKKEGVAKRKELVSKYSSSKLCVAVDCRKQYENETRDFIKTGFADRGKNVSYDVVSRMIEENGTDLLNISNEIEKLSLFAGGKKSITLEDVEYISGHTKEANVYSLAAEIEAKNLKKALFVLEKLLVDGEEPVVILSTIVSCVRRLLEAKSMIEERGASSSEISSALRMHPYFAKTFVSNLHKHDFKRLKDSMKTVLKADAAIKTGASDAASALEKALILICR
ncbi:DNA polymerase III subunit delta [Endomicrobium proavitum]|uniref:DNA polymerase III subunit delta n=1 Tax=Endomicrobium proavitum TaxID=1408281 RepID=A0A0G3WJD5_9BACT|nr:DNA polymerase III subunit delta [Endomicrobium proavitum]AKL97599.1 DNA polymerase III delta subunit [Endomicrobium proavitum]